MDLLDDNFGRSLKKWSQQQKKVEVLKKPRKILKKNKYKR